MSANNQNEIIERLGHLGIAREDAIALRRISMTLGRWFEMECGDSNDYASWVITRGRKEMRHGQHAGGHGAHHVFIHDENGKPYIERHNHKENEAHYTPIADRETGARKRLAKIMAKYPTLTAYVQPDPRGASLYILRPTDMIEGADIGSYYSRGIAVYK